MPPQRCWLHLALHSVFLFVETPLSLLTLPAPPTSSPGMIMIGVIIGSRKIGINPDNVATPIAASLGDLITLALLSGISWGLYLELSEPPRVWLGWSPGWGWERW